jgi:hypothetical protein
MIAYLALIVAAAALFYLAVPGVGAFLVRAQWRTFRKTILEISRYPMLNPRGVGRERNAFVGYFRFFGALEAIQGGDRIWITNGTTSVAADLRNVSVYTLPESSGLQGRADTELRVIPWARVFSLPEGATILVGGALFSEDGRGVFRTHGRMKPLVVIYDCKKEHIVRRVIWSGRQSNEYWNQFTLPSVIVGSFSLMLLAYFCLINPSLRIPALVALTASLAPITPFLPPAFPFYFLYRHFWKKARLMRAQRDVVRLPLRYFPPSKGRARDERPRRATLLPDLEPYVMVRGMETELEELSILCEGETIFLPPETRRVEIAPTRTLRRFIEEGGESCAFGAYSEEGDSIVLKRPQDPMAELVIVPGEPEAISTECEKTARLYEGVSALFISADVAVNAFLVFILLARLVG